jgi:hypothetical protein
MLFRLGVKRIALLVLTAAFVCGCDTSSVVSQAPNPVKCQVTLATPPMLDAASGSGSFAISTQPECAWNVTTGASWISAFSPPAGQGPANVSFRVAANDGASTRDGMIVVNGEQVRVSQRAPCRYDVGPSSQNVSASGGAGTLNVATTSDCAWTAASDASWIAVASSAAGNGNGTVGFTVAPNAGGTRSDTIAVGNQRSTITQAAAGAAGAPACNATISPTSQSVAAAGGPGAPITVAVAGSCQWTVTSGAPWITINSGAMGTGNGAVTFSVAANLGASRTGTLTIASRPFTVTQGASGSPAPPPPPPPPATCSYSISPRTDSVPVVGGAGTVDVSTTTACAWTASSNATWITVTSGASGAGDGRVGYLVLANVGGSRTGTITIGGQPFTVTQAALVCSYSISPGHQKVDAPAGTGTVSVSANAGCTWTAQSNESWITVTSGARGTGDGTVIFSYTENDGKKRKGSLTVAGRTAEVEQEDDKKRK